MEAEKLQKGMRVKCPSGRIAVVRKTDLNGRAELRYVDREPGVDAHDNGVTLPPSLLCEAEDAESSAD